MRHLEKLPEDTAAFHKTSKDELKNELAATTKNSTGIGQLLNDIRAEVVDLQEKFGAKDAVIRTIVEDSCVSLVQTLRRLVENFRAGHCKSVNKVFPAGSIGSQFHVNAAIHGITDQVSECAASDDGHDLNKGKDFVDLPADADVIEL